MALEILLPVLYKLPFMAPAETGSKDLDYCTKYCIVAAGLIPPTLTAV